MSFLWRASNSQFFIQHFLNALEWITPGQKWLPVDHPPDWVKHDSLPLHNKQTKAPAQTLERIQFTTKVLNYFGNKQYT